MDNSLKERINYHEPAYICQHIFEDTEPILLVVKEDGDWQFLCGKDHDEDEVPRVVGIGHLLERDESLLELLDLEDSWEAERPDIHSAWVRKPIS
jgi:hypothetical protein